MNEPENQDIATVVKIQKEKVTIELKKSGACKNCSVAGLCMGQNSSVRHQVKSDMKLKMGDKVTVSLSSNIKLLSSLIIFIFPILMMVLVYSILKLLGSSENLAIFLTILSLPLSAILIRLLDKYYEKKIDFKIINKVCDEDILE